MSSDNQRKIVEDAPLMRSVALHTSSAVTLPRRAAPALAKQFRASTEAKQTTSPIQPAPRPQWIVGELMCPPSMYVLDRTHVFVSEASPQVVASRVADSLREQSIAAIFNKQEACLRAETQECVCFVVRLWLDDEKRRIIVEVQRSSGDSYLFRKCAKAVLRAAKGLVRANKPKESPPPVPLVLPQSGDEDRRECWEEGLGVACRLLQSDRLDEKVMAIESLVHLTKVCRCPVFTAESILSGEVLVAIVSLIERSGLRDWDNGACAGDLEVKAFEMMHRNALVVMSNCLGALDNESGDLAKVMGHADNLSSDRFVEALVDDVLAAQSRPHDACQAVLCLQRLARASQPVQRKVARDLGVCGALSSVSTQCRHAQLEEASERLLMEIDG